MWHSEAIACPNWRCDMKIQIVRMSTNESAASDPVVMVELSGSVDPEYDVLKRARQLVLENGTEAMVESFDAALKSGSFFGRAAKS